MYFCLFSLKNANAQVVGSSETEEDRSNEIITFTSLAVHRPWVIAPHLEIAHPFFPVLSYRIVGDFELKILCL